MSFLEKPNTWLLGTDSQGNRTAFKTKGMNSFKEVGEYVKISFKDNRKDVMLKTTAEKIARTLGLLKSPAEISNANLQELCDYYGWEINYDNQDQIVIYTGLQRSSEGDLLIPFDPESEEKDGTD